MAEGNEPMELTPDLGVSDAGGQRAGQQPQPPPGTTQIRLNQYNLFDPHIGQAHLSAQTLGVQGPVFINMNPFARFNTRHQRPNIDDQALWTVPPPEDMAPYFKPDDLDRDIEEKYLSFVANSCNEDANWRRLARKLKLDGPSISRLEENYIDNMREFIYQLLITWKRRHPEFKVRDLVKVLSESRMRNPALELNRLFTSIHG